MSQLQAAGQVLYVDTDGGKVYFYHERRMHINKTGRGMPKYRVIHTCDLKPGADTAAFERFMVSEFFPAKLKLPGCLQAQLLRGYRGGLPGAAQSRVDYAWITLWESVERNNEVWSRDGEHETPASQREPQARLYEFAATVTLVGGFVVAS
ncbi:MAG: hypothetical protein OXT69_10490 [Candidatus Poribacteria bacterium]|nr:hypothetical protein [Candidatus Poribacteria bacterium]